MNLSGHYFIYGGRSSEQFGLRVLQLNTDRLAALSSEIEYKTSFSRGLKRFKIKGIDYSKDPLTFDIEFISEEPLDPYTASEAKKWLFNKAQPQKLYCDPQHDNTLSRVGNKIKREYLNCVFYNPTEIRAANGLRGWQAKCLTDGVMATQEEAQFDVADFTDKITIDVDTNIDDYVYPQLLLKLGTGNDPTTITITNESDNNRQFVLENVRATLTLYIDNEVGTVIDSTNQSWYGSLVNKRFLRLVPGRNVLTVTGNVESMTIKFNNARWAV